MCIRDSFWPFMIAPQSIRFSFCETMCRITFGRRKVSRRVIDARLAKADLDIKEGRVYGPFDTADEMANSIETNLKKLRAAKRRAVPVR